jgi:molybdopterin synthase sulfur carrier subunit
MTKEIRIDYYAIFREQRGLSSESHRTQAQSLRDLYCELQQAHGFKLPIDNVRVAVGDEFVDWDQQLKTGDTVVFIAPVAGG